MKPTPNDNPLTSSIQYIKGVGPKLGALFSKKGISTIEDALFFAPREYQDRSKLTKVRDLVPGRPATVFARVVSGRSLSLRGGNRFNRFSRGGFRSGFEATVKDETGLLNLFWFNAFPTLKEEFKPGQLVVLFGNVEMNGAQLRIAHPDFELIEEKDGPGLLHGQSTSFGRVVPIYSETEGLTQKVIRRVVHTALNSSLPYLNDPLPESTRTRLGLPTLRDSVMDLHYPANPPMMGELPEKTSRLVFEEFFALELGLMLKKKGKAMFTAPELSQGGAVDEFAKHLPFALTDGQLEAIRVLVRDIGKREPMTRLLQGDVGCGKTVVALAAAAVAARSGYQVAFMAPTEILAEQHIKNAERYLKPMGISFGLLSSSADDKKRTMELLANGKCQVAIGTHALFQADVQFAKLGLVIVDEQHRFGVNQRNELMRKSGKKLVPHLLMMTATPIPRSLALTAYGDLDITTIREKPAGRQPIDTKIFYEAGRQKLYEQIAATLGRGEQVYVIYPLIEESEKVDLKSASKMFETFRDELFPGAKVGLLHGKMESEEKDRILETFRRKEIEILISTTVIEVGIDVPNATLMVIEHPERLGLSQLHQLRGRVGRGGLKGRCYLITKARSPRLQIFTETEDGFRIAEEDLKIRGPGEFMGTRQSGMPGFRLADLQRDSHWLLEAKEEAERILEHDPELKQKENAGIRDLVESRWKSRLDNLRSG